MFELQEFIFEREPSQKELSLYEAKSTPQYRIGVYRNHSFELIERSIGAYLDFAGIGAEFIYSGYDDSLSFNEADVDVDLIILWVDLHRYLTNSIESFLEERVDQLRTIYSGNILLIPYGGSIELSGVATYSLEDIQVQLGKVFVDKRMSIFSGTDLSALTLTAVAKSLGLNYIPALLCPLKKGIVVDLDNTLYKGVLGEDGIDGIEITEGHKKLQRKLKKLGDQGFFLAIASKNHQDDVLELLESHNDFILTASDFVKICANWDSKANSIADICKFLNVASDSLLFIDDNLGEINSVLNEHRSIGVILAKENAEITTEVLSNFPGFLKLNERREDSLRVQDTIANQKRNVLKKILSTEEYICSLEVELTFSINRAEHIPRIAELSNKTNQFIFSYQRYSEAQVESLCNDTDACVVSVAMRDKLSDSGIVAAIVIKNDRNLLTVEEVFVSCRALGRGFDDVIVLGGIKAAVGDASKKMMINFIEGERNSPAQKFVQIYLSSYLGNAESFEYDFPEKLLSIKIQRENVD